MVMLQCDSPREQSLWISQLQRVIHVRQSQHCVVAVFDCVSLQKSLDDGTLSPTGRGSILDTPLPPVPASPRSSIISNDSGFGASAGGEVKRGGGRGIRSAPVSGDGQFVRRVEGNNSDGVCGRPPVKVRPHTVMCV